MGITNSRFQKNANVSLVTRTIWRSRGISRVQIADELGLYRSTVTNIVSTLIDAKVVHEVDIVHGKGGSGRRPVGLDLDGSFGCVVGIELQAGVHHVAIMDIAGTVLYTASGEFTKSDLTKVVVSVMKSLSTTLSRLHRPVLAIGIAAPGVIDSTSGRILHSIPLDVFSFDMSEPLHEKFGVPVLLDNDANCFAWLELGRHRKQRFENFLCILGVRHAGGKGYDRADRLGIGLGLAIDGRVYAGQHWSAGEMVTHSWSAHHEGQSGLERSSDDQRQFIRDFFTSLIPVISTLDPQSCIVQGEPLSANPDFPTLLKKEVPQFLPALERNGCAFVVEPFDPHAVAKGAAMAFLWKLYSMPEVSGQSSASRILWDEVMQSAAQVGRISPS